MKEARFRLLIRELAKQEMAKMQLKEAGQMPVDLTQDPKALGGGKDRLGKFIQDNYQKLIGLISAPPEMIKFLEDSKPNITVSDEYWQDKFIGPLQKYLAIPSGKQRFARVAKFYSDILLSAAGLGMGTLKEDLPDEFSGGTNEETGPNVNSK